MMRIRSQLYFKLIRESQKNRYFSSVSSSEVSKFSGMSDSWWNPRQNPLVGMNPTRVSFILDTLGRTPPSPPLSGLKILDVGCGGGLLSESLARLGANVTAIDPSKALVNMAREHAQHDTKTATIDYRPGTSIEELRSTDELKFDVICILEVLEHVTDVESILQSASSLLDANGTLFVSTINRTLKSHLLGIVGAEYIMRYLPPGTHTWRQFLSPQEVNAKMNHAGLVEIHTKGMILTAPPFNGNWHWKVSENDRDCNWIGAYKHITKGR